MSSIKETHFPACLNLLKASKETLEQGIKYIQNQQQKHQHRFKNIFLVSKSQTLKKPTPPT